MQQKIRALFQERLVFVKRRRKPSAPNRFLPITRGLPPLRKLRKLRQIIAHLYALCARRCRTQTALGKRRKLRP
jgi:hypothetical protein